VKKRSKKSLGSASKAEIADIPQRNGPILARFVALRGGASPDELWGGRSSDYFYCCERNVLYGEGGSDYLVGSYGHPDVLKGGDGRFRISCRPP
jgi:hypothetical protein